LPEVSHNIHVSDDWLSANISDIQQIHILSKQLRNDDRWVEVIGGLQSIAVQFDPAHLAPYEAAGIFERQLQSSWTKTPTTTSTITLPVCYHQDYAPDLELVAEALGIRPASTADWHSHLQFTVSMLGFMPGFAYLKCDSDVPNIGRLSQPRQKVIAGSIGIIGDQSCIYSFDSPGGWPIIGRTASKLFNPNNDPVALLSIGQELRFKPVSKSEFEELL